MTTDAQVTPAPADAAQRGRLRAGLDRAVQGRALPIATVSLAIVLLWYALAVWLNADLQINRFERADQSWTFGELVLATWAQDRPMLPAPHQIVAELNKTVFQTGITSVRSLVYHSWVTLSSTLAGFAIGTLLGILLAVGIVHARALEKSLLPWIISSQTVPILAIAPMIVVVLGAIGLNGLIPKAVISMYLCFFPVAIGMVKGLRAPDPLQMDLMRTYSASRWQTFWMLRWPSSLPFLFASLKVAIAISLVGAIVAELPTGAQAGLGARMLAGSYYGQTIQIWSALVAASVLAASLVGVVALGERWAHRRMGAQP
ncbi:ABC transporter permease [Rhodovibrio sodomensis]|uniref:ABC transporter permease n=1 Tax=Rhodovibrio sodomensis TaxID=1088 RepID=A0ABS1DL67_9PROT|nr:ABC transporter permease [Rhodovibrio sodomensis]MBK1670862.1 ABC transporter permease [Rhodovibrio sodomensis]